MPTPSFRVEAIDLHERPVTLRLPFRFGGATLTACPQAFVRARIAFADGRTATGAAAELMVPKWFDKSPGKTAADNAGDLRAALVAAAEAYIEGRVARPAFGHFAAHYRPLLDAGAGAGRNALTSGYGPALVDRAVLDALCRDAGVSFHAALARNLPGIDASVTPDLAGVDLAAFLATLAPRATIAARHTVGLVDPITAADVATRVNDGLPETLDEVVAAYGNRHFKLKVGGDVDADLARLTAIARVLDRLAHPYHVTLDGNEQYRDPAAIVALWRALAADPVLARFAASVLWIEQPLPRELALRQPIGALAGLRPVLIDESDENLDAFPRAREQGYAGVSCKSCKGVYKSLLNAARAALWNRETGNSRFFVSGEDLTAQAGLAVQQDLALASALGLAHVERNGHHYVNGFAGQGAPASEGEAFLAAHPALYERSHGGIRLRLRDGVLDLRSLAAPGFASGAEPDWSALPTLEVDGRDRNPAPPPA